MYSWVDFSRFIAIFLVILVHCSQHFESLGFLSFGQYGVQLFFILSAFTLFTSFDDRFSSDGANQSKYFFIRRLFRIVPLYTLAILFYLSLEVMKNGLDSVSYWKVAISALYLNGIIPVNYLPPGGWSIGTEMAFYVLLPFLFKYLDNIKKAYYFFLFSILLSISFDLIANYFCSIFNLNYQLLKQGPLYFWLPNQLPVFAIGIILFHQLKNKSSGNYFSLFLILSILLFLISFQLTPTYSQSLLHTEYIASILFFTFLIKIEKLDISFIPKFFFNIGKYSFGMYLSHFFIIEFFIKLNLFVDNFFLFYFWVLLTTYLVSSFLYKFERFAILYGNNLIEKMKNNSL